MSRNGPFGQPGARPPQRRPAGDADPYGGGQAAWPPAQAPDPYQQGYPQAGALGGPPQHSQGYYFPQTTDPDRQHAYPVQPVSQTLPFDQHLQAPAPQWDTQQVNDAGHYDLGSYLPAGGEPRGYGAGEPPPFAPATDSPFRHQGRDHGYADPDSDYDPIAEEEEEEPRRGRRGLLIAGALVGAVGLGGAMAYTYKTFIATPTRAPVVKVTDPGPTKVKPSLSGGKEFAHTDKKLLNRLEDESGAQRPGSAADDRGSEDPNAPRRVRSIPILPAGQMAGAGNAPAVPGITLDNMGPPPGSGRVQIPPGPPPQAVAARADSATAQPPVRIVAAPPAQAAPAAQAEPTPPPRKAIAAAAPREAAPPAREAAPAPPREAAPKAPAAVVTASTSGYVAVLSSQKSRMDALKAFADLQQKYGDVLSSKTPDVQEANLGDRGIWYRAVVGPPVSRDAASGICSQLKAAGYASCWVTAY